MHSLPLFLRLSGRPVILLGEGEAAEAKRRLLERAGAHIGGEESDARIAIVALEGAETDAAVARLRARGILINAVDRPDLCDFTLPAIVDRNPVLVAIGTGGASAGLAAALRQRLETILPAPLGTLASQLFAERAAIRRRYPDGGERRRALGTAFSAGGALDPFGAFETVADWISNSSDAEPQRLAIIDVSNSDPDAMTLRDARFLAAADRIYHMEGVPTAILDRARADAERHLGAPPVTPLPGLTVFLKIVAS
jgi:uroporphyrin-III C-methyltransferase / precorrin-2 dehydrogenase / sirohydrochlorin ferrochelatase